MAEFAWEARGKTGEVRKGVMEAETRGHGQDPPAPAAAQPDEGQEEVASDLKPPDRHRRRTEGPRHLHAPLRHDDRRRPAHRAVPRHPRRPDGQQALPGHPQGHQVERRAGLHVQRLAAQAPQGVRPALLQPRPGRRGRRHPRHHPEPPRRLHREERQAEAPGQGGHGLPDRRPRASSPACSRSCSSSSSRRSRRCSRTSAPRTRCPR